MFVEPVKHIFMNYTHTHTAYKKCQECTLRCHHNGRDSVSNHQPHDCLLNRLFRHRSTKISKVRVTGLCVGNSPGTGEFPAQMASYAENVSIWWRHHEDRLHLMPLKADSWRRYDMVEALSELLAFCERNPPVMGGILSFHSKLKIKSLLINGCF